MKKLGVGDAKMGYGRRLMALVMCLCVLCGAVPAYSDIEIVTDPLTAPTVDQGAAPASVPAKGDYELAHWCVNGLKVNFTKADGTPITDGMVIPNGQAVKIALECDLKADAQDSWLKDETQPVLYWSLPAKMNYTNTEWQTPSPYAISFRINSNRVEVKLLEAFFSREKGDYRITGLIQGTINFTGGGGSGEVSYEFTDDCTITIKVQPTVTLTKSIAKNIYYDSAQNLYFADYKLTLVTDTDLTSAAITDTAGKWVRVLADTVKLNGAAVPGVTASQSGNHSITTISLQNLAKGTHVITYTAKIVPDVENAFENGYLSKDHYGEYNALRKNKAKADWVAKNTLTGTAESEERRVTWEKPAPDVKSLTKTVSAVGYETVNGVKKPYADYTISFELSRDVPSDITLRDVRGEWLLPGSANIAQMKYDTVLFAGTPPTATRWDGSTAELTSSADRTLTWSFSNAKAGWHKITYRVYIDPAAYQNISETQKGKNTATLTWNGGTLTSTAGITLSGKKIFKRGELKDVLTGSDGKLWQRVAYQVWFDYGAMDADLSKLKLIDTYTKGMVLEYPVKVCLKGDKSKFFDIAQGDPRLTVDQANNTFTLDFSKASNPAGFTADNIDIFYTMVFPLDGSSLSQSVKNTIGFGDGSGSASDDKTVTNDPTIQKELVSGNPETDPMTARWKTTITLPAGQTIPGARFEDVGNWNSKNYLWFDEAVMDLRITKPDGVALDPSHYDIQISTVNGGHSNNRLRITFKQPLADSAVGLAQSVVIEYTTYLSRDIALANDQKNKFVNVSSLTYNYKTISSEAEWQWSEGASIQKSGIPVYVAAEGATPGYWAIDWKITAHAQNLLKNRAVKLQDLLPAGLAYIDGSAVLKENEWSENPIVFTLDKTMVGEREQLTFTFTCSAEGTFALSLRTKLDPPPAIGPNDAYQQSFKNVASLYDQETGKHLASDDAEAAVKIEGGKVLQKSGVQDKDRVKYTVRVNQNALDLDTAQDHLVLKDSLNLNTELVPMSIRVTSNGTALGQVNGNPGSMEYSYTYDTSSNLFTVKLPDALSCVVEFEVRFLLPVGENITINNKVELSGANVTGETGDQQFTVEKSDWTVIRRGCSLEISKTNIDTKAPVAGAEFSVYEVTAGNGTVTVDDTPKVTGVTDAKGFVKLPQNSTLRPVTLYCLKETKPAPGYAPNATERFFIFKGTDMEYYQRQVDAYRDAKGPTAQLWELEGITPVGMTNKESTLISITFGKKWADRGDESKRPAKVEITLYRQLGNGPKEEVSTQVFEMNSTNSNQYTFSYKLENLPTQNDAGEKYLYTVGERLLNADESPYLTDDYTMSTDGYYAVNTYKKPAIQIYKRFAGLGESDPIPAGTKLALYAYPNGAIGDKLMGWDVTQDTVLQIIDAGALGANASKWDFGNTYLLREEAAATGYIKAADVVFTIERGSEGNGTKIKVLSGNADISNANNQLALTNLKDTKISVTVQKKWRGSNGAEMANVVVPATFTLLENGKPYTEAAGGAEATLTAPGYRHTWSNLPTVITGEGNRPASYSVRETPVGGYAATYESLVDDNGNVTYTCTNTQNLYFSIAKKDTVGNELHGATLKLEQRQSGAYQPVSYEGLENGEWTTNAQNNPKVFEGLSGEFRLSEVAPPNGYAKAEPIEFEVAIGADGQAVYSIGGKPNPNGSVFVMTDRPLSVRVKKLFILSDGSSVADSAAPHGTELQVWDGATLLETLVVGPGQTEFTLDSSKLAVGKTYTVRESKTAPGYVTASDYQFSIRDDGTVSYTTLEGATETGETVVVRNRKIDATRLSVQKLWEEYGSAADTARYPTITVTLRHRLAGATEYEDVLVGGVPATRALNTANGWQASFDDLPATDAQGTAYEYTIVENVIVPGYEVAYARVGDSILITNSTTTVDGSFSKKTIAGSEELPGASLRLEKLTPGGTVDGTWPAVEWVSGNQPYTLSSKLLEIGASYRLTETIAPLGYAVAESIDFTVSKQDQDGREIVTFIPLGATGTVEGDRTLTMRDKQTEIMFEKLDRAGAGAQGVAGATLALTDLTANPAKTWTLETKAGQTSFTLTGELTANHQYKLEETVTPDGYIPAQPIYFSLDSAGKAFETGNAANAYAGNRIPMVNVPFALAVHKTDEQGAALGGATLAVYSGSHASGVPAASLRVGELVWKQASSRYVLESAALVYGSPYTIVEEISPDGYACAPNILFLAGMSAQGDPGVSVADAADTGIKTFTYAMVDRSLRASFTKIRGGNSAWLLPGVTLTLYERNGDGTLTELDRWTTAEDAANPGAGVNNPYIFTGLTVGRTYVLRETGVPEGFLKAEDIVFSVERGGALVEEASGSAIKDNAVIMNNNATGTTSLEVEKIWQDHGVTVAHGSVSVRLERRLQGQGEADWRDAGRTAELNESGNWKHTFADLPDTDEQNRTYEYRAVETTNVEGYTTTAVTAAGKTTVTNRRNTLEIWISKRAVAGNDELAGASLQLTDQNGAIVDQWESGTAPHKVKMELAIGASYTLSETLPPFGYLNAGSIVFEVAWDSVASKAELRMLEGEINGEVANDLTLVLRDRPFALRVQKTFEAGADTALSTAATLEIWDAAGQKLLETLLVTNDTPVTLDAAKTYLAVNNTYLLREATQPEGYVRAAEIPFTIGADGTASYGELAGETTVVMDNRLTAFGVQKTDETSAPLGGATLLLTRQTGADTWTRIAEWTTDADNNPKIFKGLTGTFTLAETAAPKGYTLAEPVVFTVETNEAGQPVYSLVSPNGGLNGTIFSMVNGVIDELKIKKLNRLDQGDFVPGALLSLYDLSGGEALIDQWTTGNAAHAVPGRLLTIGHTYELRETTTPDGYVPAPPIRFTISDKGLAMPLGSSAPYPGNEIPVINQPFSVRISKTDGTAMLPGAVLALYRGQHADGSTPAQTELVERWSTDETLKSFTSLIHGQKYTIMEEKSPDGYAHAPYLTFTAGDAAGAVMNIETDGSVSFGYTLVDKPIAASIRKVNAGAGLSSLAGVTLTLSIKAADGTLTRVAQWTTANPSPENPTGNNPYIVTGLIVGETYVLSETGVPEGFRQSLDIVLTVRSDGTLVNADGMTLPNNAVEMINHPTDQTSYTVVKEWQDRNVTGLLHPEITVRLMRRLKADATAAFEDMRIDGAFVEHKLNAQNHWKHIFAPLALTDKDGGEYEYSARELTELPDYTAAYRPAAGGMSMLIVNKYKYAAATFSKRDITGANELEGAVLRLTDRNGALVKEWISAQTPVRLDQSLLTIGETYTLTETIAPAGYAQATESVVFRVDENPDGSVRFTITGGTNVGNVDQNGVVYMKDRPLDLSVVKTDENGNPLAGAKLELYEGAGIAGRKIASWISSGRAEYIRALAANANELFKRGQTYTLHEATPPSGYAAAPDVVFTFTENASASVQNIVMKDLPMDLVIEKRDATGANAIIGAELALYRAPVNAGDAPAGRWVSDGKAWRIGFSTGYQLEYGATYVIRELTAPAGYAHAPDQTFTLNAATLKEAKLENGDKLLTLYREVRNEGTGASILKLDAQTGLPLAGAMMELYHVRGNGARELIESWTTTEQPRLFIARLVVGEAYLVRESKAPDGFALCNEYLFEMKDEYTASNPLVITLRDDHIYRFRKQNSVTGGVVAGATLAIYDVATGELVQRWHTTNDDYHEIVGTLRVGGVYLLREITAPEGYRKSRPITFSINAAGMMVLGSDGAAANSLSLLVMLDEPIPDQPPPQTLNLTVTKQWEDVNNTLGKRPSFITLELYQRLATQADFPAEPLMTVEVRPQDVNSNTWRFTFNDLEWYNGRGTEYRYMVRERAVPGYNVRYVNNGRTIINSIPEEDVPVTPTPTLPNITPTPAPTGIVPAGVKLVDGEWVYIDEYGVPLGLVPQTGDDTNWLLWGLAIVLPLLLASFAAIEIRRRRKQAAIRAHRNNG